MNSSFSKKRHIQEVNQKLENRLLINEETNSVNLASNMLSDVGVDPSQVVDADNPMCVPQTGDVEQDGILTKVWDWAHDPANFGNLKSKLSEIKAAVSKAKQPKQEMEEQVGVGVVIGTVTLGPSVLIAIGALILVIIVVAIVSKTSGRTSGHSRKSCVRRSKKNWWGHL